MEVLFKASAEDYGTNIERAKAIIDAVMNHGFIYHDYYNVEENLRELEEIKDYIDVYVKHKKGEIEYERNRKSCGDY